MGGNSERREGNVMSRWLWVLLGGVVLVGIAAVVWTASNQTDVTPTISSSQAPVAPAPVTPAPVTSAPVAQKPAASSTPTPTAQEAALSPPPSPAPPVAQQATTPTVPAATAPAPAAGAAQQAASPPAPAPSVTSPAPPVIAPKPPPPSAPAPLAEAPLPPAPEKEAPEAQGQYAPKSLAQLVGAWAYSTEDCDKLFQRRGDGWVYRQPVDKFAQAAIVESPKRILLPSSTCQIESASEVEGALKVSAECADAISFTSRSTVITLRSATELVYSASGNSVLATTLKKCAQ